MMRALAIEGSKQLDVREATVNVLRRAGVRPHDTLGELTAIYNHVRDRVRFTSDISGVETLQGPRYTLQKGFGDCDDKAVAIAGMALSVGIDAAIRFRAIAPQGRYSHVYVVATVDGRRLALDPTYGKTPAGWELPRQGRALEVPV